MNAELTKLENALRQIIDNKGLGSVRIAKEALGLTECKTIKLPPTPKPYTEEPSE